MCGLLTVDLSWALQTLATGQRQNKQNRQNNVRTSEMTELPVNPRFCFTTRPPCLLLQDNTTAGSPGPFQGMLFFIFSRTFSTLQEHGTL